MTPTFGTLSIGNGGQLLMEQTKDVNWDTTITPTGTTLTALAPDLVLGGTATDDKGVTHRG